VPSNEYVTVIGERSPERWIATMAGRGPCSEAGDASTCAVTVV